MKVGELVLRVLLIGVAFLMLSGCMPPQPEAGSDQVTSGSFLFQTIYFVVVVYFVYWMLVLRPQQLKVDEQKKFLEGIKKGAQVLTTGGIYGKVAAVKDDHVMLEVAQNVRIKVDRDSVRPLKPELAGDKAAESKDSK